MLDKVDFFKDISYTFSARNSTLSLEFMPGI